MGGLYDSLDRWMELQSYFAGGENRGGAWIKYHARKNSCDEFKNLSIAIAEHCSKKRWDATALFNLAHKIEPGTPPRCTIPAGCEELLSESWAIVMRCKATPNDGPGAPKRKEVADRRAKVAMLTNEGMTEGDIAAEMEIPKETVKADRKAIKLGK